MHPSYAASLNNIGITYDSKGYYDKALEYYFKSIEIEKNVLG
jgi:tetratricopeptide (TPR) repeat protein